MVPDIEREWIEKELKAAPTPTCLPCLIWALLLGIAALLLWISIG